MNRYGLGTFAIACLLMTASCDCGTGGTGGPCEPTTCEELGRDCGTVSDGCDGELDCGDCTRPGETCGGGGVDGVCGSSGPACTPRTCDEIGDFCGPMPDGCGGFVECVVCDLPETCGGGGVPSKCGVAQGGSCTLVSCADQGLGCGLAGDGCGGILDCGSCPDGQACGGGGVPSQCGTPTCTPLTCADLGAECGRVGDGCGGLTEDCGTCTPPDTCGGGGVPSKCGSDPQGSCVGLCQHQVQCPAGQATALTGTVRAPNGVEPIYNAVVYVPNGPIPPIQDGIACERCEDQDYGEVLVATVTGSDGSFVLSNVPAGVGFPLVVQVGKWRRVVDIPAVSACSTVALTTEQTRLPRNSTEGNIPKIAISTGAIDGLECVFYKAGVDASEFTRPDGNGRIHLYRANGAWPDDWLRQNCSSNCTDRAPSNCSATCREVMSDRLYTNPATLAEYDVVVFGCEASRNTNMRTATNRGNIRDYVNSGGRLFLSHWAFDWVWNYSGTNVRDQSNTLYATDPLHTTCDWQSGDFYGGLPETGACNSPPCVTSAFVDQTFDRGASFSEWLDHVSASNPTSGVVQIHEPRAHCPVTIGGGRTWIYTTQADHGGDSVQQFTFNTPVGVPEDEMCGRVVYSAFHVTVGSTASAYFPDHCGGALTPQEKVLLFMFFDLAACISDDTGMIAPCNRLTCEQAGAECGLIGDGCGGELYCGDCPPGQTCGGGGVPYRCGSPCVPTVCGDNQCGYVADGCGGIIDCGDCPPGLFCGGGGVPNECGSGCTALTCPAANAECGTIPDGCGGLIDCGECPPGSFCVTTEGGTSCVSMG